MRNCLLPGYEDGLVPDYAQLAAQERQRQWNIAKQYMQNPSLPNIFNAMGAVWNAMPFNTTAATVNPYMSYGEAPSTGLKPANTIKYLGSEKNWLDYANQLIRRNKLQTVQAGGKTYVKTPNGGMRSILNFGRDEYQTYQQNILQQMKQEASKMTGSYTPYETYTPTRLSHTSGSINKVRGKLSNRNAIDANAFEP